MCDEEDNNSAVSWLVAGEPLTDRAPSQDQEERKGGEDGQELMNQSERLRTGLPLHSHPGTTLSSSSPWEVLGGTEVDPYVPTEKTNTILYVPQLTNLHSYFNGNIFLQLHHYLLGLLNSFCQHWTLSRMPPKEMESRAFLPFVLKWVPCTFC